MKPSSLKLIVVILALLLFATAYAATTERQNRANEAWRYKMTVVVETPEGLKRGSAVREIRVVEYNCSRDRPCFKFRIHGEAVVVDLGTRGVLFSPMWGTYGPDYAHEVVISHFPFGIVHSAQEMIHYYSGIRADRVVLTPEEYPTLVAFKDVNDPASVVAVLEHETDNKKTGNRSNIKFPVKVNRTEELFGRGVRIKEISFEFTHEPITVGIQKYLKWLPEYYNQKLDGYKLHDFRAQNQIASSLGAGAFSTEIQHVH